MNFYHQARLTIFILCVFSVMLFVQVTTLRANMIKCSKKDECSCVTNTKPQLQVSLWQINSDMDILAEEGPWKYAVDLCHGVTKGQRCQNSSVCQYESNSVFEIGHYGTARFDDYDNETKSIYVHYSGANQNNVSRSIKILLNCSEDGNVALATYTDFGETIHHDGHFYGTITTKAACLKNVSSPETSKTGGLRTIDIVAIVIGSCVFLCLCGFIGYLINVKIVKKKRSLLDEDMDDDYGTCSTPSVHIQNASSSSLSRSM